MKTDIRTIWRGDDVKIKGKRVMNHTAYEIGLVIEGQAKLLAPKDTGYLAASITTQAYGGQGTMPESPFKYRQKEKPGTKGYSDFEMTIQSPQEENVVLVGTPLEYAVYQEFGTAKMNSQPFLRPAMDLAKGKALTIAERNSKLIFKDYLRRPGEKW